MVSNAPAPALRALVIYHADCTDGACAAWAARHHLNRAGFHVVTLPTHPGITPEGAFAEEWAHVFVVDVCIPRADAERLGAWVLDHHKTNQPLLAGYDRAFFDMSRSGAGLAWDEVQAILWGEGCGVVPRAERPWFVSYVEDRDLWRWALPQSREVNAALCLLGRDVDVFDDLLAQGIGGFIEDGRAILKAQADAVERACRHPLRGSLFGVPVVHVASPNHQSEIGERLTAEHGTVAVVWYLREDSERGPVAQVSIRSRDELADASELAAALGGGGHRNAAGAVVAAASWLRQIDPATGPRRIYLASPLSGDIAANPPVGGWWLNTVTGHRFPVDNPQPDDFRIVDIAIALGHQARYAGHTRAHYSVALHSVIVARAVEIAGGTPDEIRWGLLHDAAEAYYTDVPWPLIAAGLCPDLRAAEKRGMLLIAERFGLSQSEPQIVRDLDIEALHVESDHLLRRHPDWEIARPAGAAMRQAWDELFSAWSGGWHAMAFIREAKRHGLATDDAVAAVRALVLL